MPWPPLMRDVWEGARRHPVRVALPFGGIALGMLALAVLLAIVTGLRRQTQAAIAGLGVNVFVVQQAGGMTTGSAGALTRGHADLLRRNLPGTTCTAIQSSDVTIGERRVTIISGDEYLLSVRPWQLKAGRFIDGADIKEHAAVAVVSETLAKELDLRIGSAITVGPVTFRVVGIVNVESGSAEGQGVASTLAPGERVLLAPWSLPPYWLDSPAQPADRLEAIYVRSPGDGSLDATVGSARRLLDDPRRQAGSLSWITPRSLVEQLLRLRRLVMITGGFIVGLCLLMGGVTLGSLTLANVQARIPEIGLRRALGAAPMDIGLLFLMESVAVTTLATVSGVTVAALILLTAGPRLPVPLIVNQWFFVVPLATGVMLGMIFSLMPARAAAGIAPAEALRNE